ncbi:hypothetical protein [Methylopila sp. 73B]|uniref:hypothetical protein n=1 Tax=Methylopila sp. 73B TaxID=1120792 RepID=UPI0012DC584B|nr:hypothetical protein [Methylopila sp. 73B]
MSIGAARLAGVIWILGLTSSLGADLAMEPWEPAPFASTPYLAANLPLARSSTTSGVLLKFDGGERPATGARVFDPRLQGTAYFGALAQEVNNFSFTAVRTNSSSGQSISTVDISAVSFNNRFNPRHPRSGGIFSRNGFQIDLKRGTQILYSVYVKNYTGNLNICGQGPDRLIIPRFTIPNYVFEAIDNVDFAGKSELYLGCP